MVRFSKSVVPAAVCLLMVFFGFAGSLAAQEEETCNLLENRNSIRVGTAPGAPAFDPNNPAGTPITIEAFNALKYPRDGTNPLQRPSAIALRTRIGVPESTVYEISDVEVDQFGGCETVSVFFSKFNPPDDETDSAFTAQVPPRACLAESPYKETFAKLFADYATVSVWKGDPNISTLCGSAGESTPRLKVWGIGFWEDSGGSSEPRLILSPILAIARMDEVPGGDTPGGDTPGGDTPPPPPPPPAVSINLPTSVYENVIVLPNDGSTSFEISTSTLAGFTGDVSLGIVGSGSEGTGLELLVDPAHIGAPGVGTATVHIKAGPMTFPRDYHVNIIATTSDGRSYSSPTIYVSVICDPPMVLGLDQPRNQTVDRGARGSLTVKATGSGPFNYQWYRGHRGGTRFPIAGANGATLANAAAGSYWVRVSNACGSIDSASAAVTER